ncbi:Phox homologous domain [Trypanosoma melophagium]|uniref:Phox homologous domain n=1 Tax=Trypanosoma melophagium TaxID=715481 RepID=UPI00351AA68C|nr:Phox homologous domain [Trypanosoma melophagium]
MEGSCRMSTLLSPESMELSVIDPIWCNNHIEYKICIWNGIARELPLSSIYRRFSEIYPVFKRLVELDPTPPLPPLPEKRFFGTSDPIFIEKRRREIENFLRAVCRNRFLVHDVAFLSLISFSDAKVALALEAEKRNGISKSSKEGLLSYITFDLPPLNVGELLLVTRQVLRSTTYSLIGVLPPLSPWSPRRLHAIIRDNSEEYILSIIQSHPSRGTNLTNSKVAERFCGLVSRSLLPCVFSPVAVFTDGIRVYIIRKIIKNGSLRDRLYNATWSTTSAQKFTGKSKPFRSQYISFVARETLVMLKSFHSSNIPCTNLHLGKCYDVDGKILFAGIEDILLGITRFPVVLPGTEFTHLDILLLGLLVLEMAMGRTISEEGETDFVSAFKDPTEAVEIDVKSRNRFVTQMLEDMTSFIPKEILSFLRTIFDPTHTVEIDELLQHPFIVNRKQKVYCGEDSKGNINAQPIQVKEKEVQLFRDVAHNWKKTVKAASVRLVYERESRFHLREMKQRKGDSRGVLVQDVSSSSTYSPQKDPLSRETLPPNITTVQNLETRPTVLECRTYSLTTINSIMPSRPPQPPPKGLPPPPPKGLPPPTTRPISF